MSMRIGDRLRVTLFGESHGKCVGANNAPTHFP